MSCLQETQQSVSSFPLAHLVAAGPVLCPLRPGEGSRALPAPRAPSRGSDLWLPHQRTLSYSWAQLCWETPVGADSGASWGHGWQCQGKAPPPHSHSQSSALWQSAASLGPSLSSFQIKQQKKICLCSAWLNVFKPQQYFVKQMIS